MEEQPNSALNREDRRTFTAWVRKKNLRVIRKFLEQIIGNYPQYGEEYAAAAIKTLFLADPGYFMREIYPKLRKRLKNSALPNPISIDQKILEDCLLADELIVTEFWGKIYGNFSKVTGFITLTTRRVIISGTLKPTGWTFMTWKMPLAQIKATREVLAIRQGTAALLNTPPCFGYCYPITSPTNIVTTKNSLTYEHQLAAPGDFGWKMAKKKIKIRAKNFYSTGTLNKFRRVITKNAEIDELSRAINVCKTCSAKIQRNTKFCPQCGTPL